MNDRKCIDIEDNDLHPQPRFTYKMILSLFVGFFGLVYNQSIRRSFNYPIAVGM